VKPAPFGYVRPRDLHELLQTLAEGDVLLAGGQSLLPRLNERELRPRRLVDINDVAELRRVDVRPDGVVLGALTRHRDLETSEEVRAALPVLACAAGHVGHAAVRTRGTLGGSVANADPAAELPGVCVLLGATAHLRSPAAGERTVPVARLLSAGGLGPSEVIVAIELPRPSAREGWGFREVSRAGAYAFPLVTVVATVTLAADGAVAGLRAAVTGAAPAPYVLGAGADALLGREPIPDWYDAAAESIADRADPADDLYASATYRRRLVRHLARHVLADAVRRAETVAA
jgi:carbon-monoxide dehydrogenase medium subunit